MCHPQIMEQNMAEHGCDQALFFVLCIAKVWFLHPGKFHLVTVYKFKKSRNSIPKSGIDAIPDKIRTGETKGMQTKGLAHWEIRLMHQGQGCSSSGCCCQSCCYVNSPIILLNLNAVGGVLQCK